MSDNEQAWQAASQMKATNVTWHFSHVGRESREQLLNQKGATLWFTGLSASGKSTIAFTLEHLLIEQGYLPYVLDGDNVRHGLNKNLGFSADDRAENIRRIGEVARLFADAGVITMTSFISPYRMDRDRVRDLHDEANVPFVEIFVDTPIAVCEDRDPKGLYQRARAGEIKMFTGIDDPYEPPLEPEIVIRADQMDPPGCARVIIERLQELGITNVNGARPAV
ncbi:MAG: adenylyl-sulfate kinase [Gammaproteobacteria bacterium]|nr:adenylyl-sulfate kinase [Gammaproteobacteria bacterium]